MVDVQFYGLIIMGKICKKSWNFCKLKTILLSYKTFIAKYLTNIKVYIIGFLVKLFKSIFQKNWIVKLTKNIKKYFMPFVKELLKPIVIVTGVSAAIALYSYNNNNDRERKTATIEYFNGFYDILDATDKQLLDTINFYGLKGKNYILDSDTLENILSDNPEYKSQLYKLMTFLNLYAISCQEKIFEEETAWAAYYSIITQSTKALIPYFEILEKERGRPGVCWFLRNMVRRWEIDPSFGQKFNSKIRKINCETEKIIKKNNIEDESTIISR